jgi:hypothetical protein
VIVIPMAGLSSRFFSEGFSLPKYQLPLHGRTLFFHSVQSFRSFFNRKALTFIYCPEYGAKAFIERELASMGVTLFHLVELSAATGGQAETVYLGTRSFPPDEPLTIFNIDTIRPDFAYPDWMSGCDGYLEVFRGQGDHWSFALPDQSGNVLMTVEKERVSELCSNGLYHFARRSDFEAAFLKARAADARTRGEFFVAPLYNQLIAQGRRIRLLEVPEAQIFFCGTPQEYRHLRASAVAAECLTRWVAAGT